MGDRRWRREDSGCWMLDGGLDWWIDGLMDDGLAMLVRRGSWELCVAGTNGRVRITGNACSPLITNIDNVCYRFHFVHMNVSLTAELESVIEGKVKSGLYNNASEVVRDALRRAFCQPQSLNLEEDSPELAALVLEGANRRHTPHRKGDIHRLLSGVRRRSRK